MALCGLERGPQLRETAPWRRGVLPVVQTGTQSPKLGKMLGLTVEQPTQIGMLPPLLWVLTAPNLILAMKKEWSYMPMQKKML